MTNADHSPHADSDPSPASGDAAASSACRFAWILLDWGASGFSTVLITLIVAYVERVAFVDAPWGLSPGVIWPWTLASAMLASAIIAPGFSAWADRRSRHKTALVASVLLGVGGLGILAVVRAGGSEGRLILSQSAVLIGVVIANVGFDLAAIFTGSLLPAIARGGMADRLSARGFAAGYAGGAVALLIATVIVRSHESLGLTMAGGMRLAFAFTGLWWLCFSLPITACRFGVRQPSGRDLAPLGGSATRDQQPVHAATATGELATFIRLLVRGKDELDSSGGSRRLWAVLTGSMLILGGVQTAISQFSSIALEEFSLKPEDLVRLVLLVQALALPGALGIGWLSERAGRGTALAVCLGGWLAALGLSYFVQTVPQLHALAALIALVLGGVQSVIRAEVAASAPEGRAGISFGLLQVGSKLAGAGVGVAFGFAALASGQPRSGLVVLLAQIALGWWFITAWRNGRRHQASSPSTSRIE